MIRQRHTKIFERALKKILHEMLSVTLPRAYKQEAMELIKGDNRKNTTAIFLDYFIGSVGYRARKLLLSIVSSFYDIVGFSTTGKKNKLHISSTESEVI